LFNKTFFDKANGFKRPLLEKRVIPKSIVSFGKDNSKFQKIGANHVSKCDFPIILNSGDSIILDFGDHNVGYCNIALNFVGQITDSPLKLRFTFGEFPYEIITSPESYNGTLGNGWLQYEDRAMAFLPAVCRLDRRYSFRYLKIDRLDTAKYTVKIDDLFCDCCSAVEMSSCVEMNIPDALLEKIDHIAVKTLKECEQDVFEDGPKRDRRLWIGDLRLQALTDMVTFKNIDLIKRCLYLFAACTMENDVVAPCVFPDSPPYVDNWGFIDYSLFFVSCLYDYVQYSKDMDILKELYLIAQKQVEYVSRNIFGSKETIKNGGFFIDWCPDLDKEVAGIGVYLYVLEQFAQLTEHLSRDAKWIYSEKERIKEILFSFYSENEGLFITASGQVSWHSQIWAILSGTVDYEDSIQLLQNIKAFKNAKTIHTPYMMHFYIEALFMLNLQDEAIEVIKEYWGKMCDAGFDCFPEVFNPEDDIESPYGAAQINSACHAWSCTPAYWIRRYYSKNL